MARLHRTNPQSLVMKAFSAAAVLALLVCLPLMAQVASGAKPAAKPTTRPTASSGADGGVENYAGLKKRRMTPEQLGRLRMLEIQSGAFRDARAAASSTTLVGPPLSDREKVQHAINRLSFGAKPGQVEQILLEGGITDQWIGYAKQQLKPDAIDDSELQAVLAKKYPWIKMSITEVREAYPYRGEGRTWQVVVKELPESVVHRAAASNRQFKEVMTEFWRNHFCIDNSPGEQKHRSWAAADYEDTVIRPHVFGKFKNMLFASARHPAMLEYLDNKLSRAGAWNENYARELMELHTLGADRGYGDGDVLELSKVLTGWQYDRSFNFVFNAGEHQAGAKKVLGRNIPGGYQGGEQAIYMLATHKYTAEFIATKLCKYLVNDNPPPALVQKVAGVFTKTEGDLPQVYEAIIFSPEFMERANYRAKFRTPFEFVVAAARATDAKVEDTGNACFELARMGQHVYNCPDPTGYYDRAEAWLDSGVLTSRWDYAFDLTRGGVKGIKVSPALVAKYKAMTPDERYKTAVKEFIGDDIGDKTRQVLKAAADEGEIETMLAILVGSPSFQQQ